MAQLLITEGVGIRHLHLTEEEWDALPPCVRKHLPLPRAEGNGLYSLVIVALPYLLRSYQVFKYTHQSGSLTNEFDECRRLAEQHYPEEYAEIMASRTPKIREYPTGGDAVLLTAEWPWAGSLCKVGSYGIIGGNVGAKMDDLSVTWNYSAHRGMHSGGSALFNLDGLTPMPLEVDWVSCSGGPATIALPAKLLKPTDQMTRVNFWCWRDMPRADGGVHYWMNVPVWTWNGKGYGS